MKLLIILFLIKSQDKEIIREKFISSLLEIYFKKDNQINDCADFIRKALLNALNKINIKSLNINKRKPFLVKEKDKFFYSSFADVKNLILYNTIFLGKNKNKIDLKSGDILFFYNPKQKFPYHSMVYIKIKDEEFLIYHTGPVENKKGELRLIKYNLIFKHPESLWFPIPSNENFLGFFRLKLFED